MWRYLAREVVPGVNVLMVLVLTVGALCAAGGVAYVLFPVWKGVIHQGAFAYFVLALAIVMIPSAVGLSVTAAVDALRRPPKGPADENMAEAIRLDAVVTNQAPVPAQLRPARVGEGEPSDDVGVEVETVLPRIEGVMLTGQSLAPGQQPAVRIVNYVTGIKPAPMRRLDSVRHRAIRFFSRR